MELYQIRHYVAVVETGSFTKGADRAAVSQPALSASILRLEAELGVQLLNRDRTGVTPTPTGRKLMAVAKEILRECTELKSELRRASSPEVLRVGVLSTISGQKISLFLRAFRRGRKGVAIELMDGSADELIRALGGRRLHVCFAPPARANSKFCYQRLFSERYNLVVPKDHPFAHRPSIELAELEGQPFIVRSNCETYAETTKLFISKGIRTQPVYRADQDDRVLALIEAGFSVALMPIPFESEYVRCIPVTDFDIDREIGLSWSEKQDNSTLSEFINFAQQYDWTKSPPE